MVFILGTELNQSTIDGIQYETEATLNDSSILIKVKLCENYLVYGSMLLPYNFDLKFEVSKGQAIFECNDKHMTFTLVRNDEKEWRENLRKYLSQKGFHELYQPIKKIGKGNFASVYLAEKLDNKCKYAVKAFSKENCYSEENGKECLIKEITIMRQLNHQSIMKLEEVFESDNSIYLVFELLEGGQLHTKIKEKYRFKGSEVKMIMKDLFEAITEMHNKGIMHRDIKPENILLRNKNEFQCVIADFGLAEFEDLEEYLYVRCGTPGYVAPEVMNVKDMKTTYSSVCDMFSLGVIFHLLLFGKSVFKSKSYTKLVAENKTAVFDFEEDEEYLLVPPETLDLLKKMLRSTPEERITSDQALAHPYFRLSEEEEMEITTLRSSMSNSFSEVVGSFVPNDSCVKFKGNKENLMKGNVETMDGFLETKVSMFEKITKPGEVGKMSKFSKLN